MGQLTCTSFDLKNFSVEYSLKEDILNTLAKLEKQEKKLKKSLKELRSKIKDAKKEAYLCGPPPMIDAAMRVFSGVGIKPEDVYFDKF